MRAAVRSDPGRRQRLNAQVRYRGVCRKGRSSQELTPATGFCEAFELHPQNFRAVERKGADRR